MAIGTLTLDPNLTGSFTAITSEISDLDYAIQYQAQTLSATLTPSRSRYGTLQNPGYAATVTPKLLWVVNNWIITTAQLQQFILAVTTQATDNAAGDYYKLTDSAVLSTINGSPVTATIRLIVDEDFYGVAGISGSTQYWAVKFSALEV